LQGPPIPSPGCPTVLLYDWEKAKEKKKRKKEKNKDKKGAKKKK